MTRLELRSRPDGQATCPFCREELVDRASVVACGGCATVYHAECEAEFGGCATAGCEGAVDVQAAEEPREPRTGERRVRTVPNLVRPPDPAHEQLADVSKLLIAGALAFGGIIGAVAISQTAAVRHWWHLHHDGALALGAVGFVALAVVAVLQAKRLLAEERSRRALADEAYGRLLVSEGLATPDQVAALRGGPAGQILRRALIGGLIGEGRLRQLGFPQDVRCTDCGRVCARVGRAAAPFLQGLRCPHCCARIES